MECDAHFGAWSEVPNQGDAVNAKMQAMMQMNDVGLNFLEEMFELIAEVLLISVRAIKSMAAAFDLMLVESICRCVWP